MKRMIGMMVASLVGLTAMSSTAFAGEVDQRQAEQQRRIEQGVQNGSMSPRETARVEHQEAAVRREINRDRRQNGGRLTGREKAKINRQENKMSGEIYRDKHN